MIKMNQAIAKKILLESLSTGADFAELYIENTSKNVIKLMAHKIDDIGSEYIHGASIRLLFGTEEVFGYTNEVSEEALLKLARELASSSKEMPKVKEIEFTDTKYDKNTEISRYSRDIANKDKLKYLELCDKTITEYSDKIVQVICQLTDTTQEILVCNSKGVYKTDIRNPERVLVSAIAKDEKGMEQGVDSYGGNFSLDNFDKFDFIEFSKSVAARAVNLLSASEMVGGVYDVVIDNAFGGVIFHEACGHSLEATSVAKKLSVFSDKLGTKIASDCVTAIDDGTIPNEWGSENIDDEGTPCRKNVLIENGVLKSYMVDYRNSLTMKNSITGSARRQSYKYSPTSRMTNTYIENGSSTLEEIIANTKYGLFAKHMGGGSVNPATGEFNFSVSEGYMIEDGKITFPVRGATLIGNGKDTLLHIDMVANNRSFGYGMCGSASGSIPVCVGQPTIRVKQMTVGGNGGKK